MRIGKGKAPTYIKMLPRGPRGRIFKNIVVAKSWIEIIGSLALIIDEFLLLFLQYEYYKKLQTIRFITPALFTS